jgi:hypothetical protein
VTGQRDAHGGLKYLGELGFVVPGAGQNAAEAVGLV